MASESSCAFKEQVCLSEGPAQDGSQTRVRQIYRAQEQHAGQVVSTGALNSGSLFFLELGLGAFTFS